MSQLDHIVIIGATSAMAEHCARLWVTQSPKKITLVARDLQKARAIAVDLQVRSPPSVIAIEDVDFLNSVAISSLCSRLCTEHMPTTVLIAHGTLPDQSLCQDDISQANAALQINGISPVLFAESFASAMHKRNSGTLIIIGSVAGDRGRKSNYVYGAAKGMVTRYAQGLQHRLAQTNVKVVLIKPGPTSTPMTAQLHSQGLKMARVEDVAALIVKGASAGKPVIYAPGKWVVIMMIIRHLPNFIFNKMNI